MTLRSAARALAAAAWLGLAGPLAAQQGEPGVTDFTQTAQERIEVDDLVQGLAASRSTRLRARPTIRLPVYFDSGSADLTDATRGLLAKLGRALQAAELESFRFSVEGHTDDVGGDGYNLGLSERRAAAVREFLLAAGVSDARLQALGKGEATPAVPNDGEEGRRRNRRVEVVNLGE